MHPENAGYMQRPFILADAAKGRVHVVVPAFVPDDAIADGTAAQHIARGALPVDEAIEITKQIAEALEAAHERGIVSANRFGNPYAKPELKLARDRSSKKSTMR